MLRPAGPLRLTVDPEALTDECYVLHLWISRLDCNHSHGWYLQLAIRNRRRPMKLGWR